jgi:uncharacterized protein (TIGR00296 family)
MTAANSKSEDPTDSLFQEQDGQKLISSSREIIEKYLESKKAFLPSWISSDPRFEKKMGCFVTLKLDDAEKSLRGCIGFPEPVYALKKALPDASISAATRDPRFPPVKRNELHKLLLEISLLTPPVQLIQCSPADLPKRIEIGRDGLILKWSFGSGLLLPQVAKEYGWDAEDFLCNLSVKAGAPPDQWLVPGTLIFRFRARIFQEASPNGKVAMLEG